MRRYCFWGAGADALDVTTSPWQCLAVPGPVNDVATGLQDEMGLVLLDNWTLHLRRLASGGALCDVLVVACVCENGTVFWLTACGEMLWKCKA